MQSTLRMYCPNLFSHTLGTQTFSSVTEYVQDCVNGDSSQGEAIPSQWPGFRWHRNNLRNE